MLSSNILHQSHLPSLHPVLHLSSHFPQSNFSFPSFSLTALCASHIHRPNSSLLPTRGAFSLLFIHSWKSVAHQWHGYNRENDEMNWRASHCCRSEGRSGYEAAMECRRFQVELPSTSTSGGQSGGSWSCWEEVWRFDKLLVDSGFEVCFFVIATQAAKEVQERHLYSWISMVDVHQLTVETNGFPSGPSTTPFGNFFGAISLKDVSSCLSFVGALISACLSTAAQKNRGRTGDLRKRWAWS